MNSKDNSTHLITLQKKAEEWLNVHFDLDTQEEIRQLINQPSALFEAFYKDIDFGTGGIRGIVGAGTNRVNAYTLGITTQALANYLHQHYPQGQPIKVAITYDTRNSSYFLMQKVAQVLTANGIEVYYTTQARPTPVLSFWVRQKKMQAGIVITASHNPKEYNGYKVYWSDGAQLVPPHDENIMKLAKNLSFSSINWNENPNLLHTLGPKDDQDYLDYALSLQQFQGDKNIKIAYSSLHGTGTTLLPKLLKQAGYLHVFETETQKEMNGDFPTVPSPNPEEFSAMEQVLLLAKEQKADLALATDPDADRVGLCIPNSEGLWQQINGQQMAMLLTYYILKIKQEKNSLPKNGYICKSIVTTNALTKIASSFGVKTYNTLTGFKWIAQKMGELEKKESFILGAEESLGYLVADQIRDKDALSSALIFSEIAAWCKEKGQTIWDLFLQIQAEFGIYLEKNISLQYEGKAGMEQMQAKMAVFRSHFLSDIQGVSVEKIHDFLEGLVHFSNGKTQKLDFPISDVLQYHLSDGSLITVRPSGTEPKLKIYLQVVGINQKIVQEKIDILSKFKYFQ
jgi:phosphoglucomutase